MSPVLIGLAIIIAVMASLWFSTLTYSVRELSRARLAEQLEKRNKLHLLEPTVEHAGDSIFITAIGRLLSNIAILIGFLRLMHETDRGLGMQYVLAVASTLSVTLFCSVAIPNALAKYAGPQLIAMFAGMLGTLRMIFLPATKLMDAVDSIVRRATGTSSEPHEEHIQQEIMEAVQEGEREGVVDHKERQMIESVIRFDDTTVNQVMTARPEMIGIEVRSSLEQIKEILEDSGHSRLPVHSQTLDKIVGVLYARDLLKYLCRPPHEFDIHSAIRSAFYVPETKKLRDLLDDFRARKVHMAIVLDEYGGTAGLVTIEDILEELVGDISDEHEPAGSATLRQVSEHVWEADGRAYLDELNRLTGLSLPEDEGFDTLGGYITTSLGHIPAKGEEFVAPFARFVTTDAEPQKINRVRIELTPTVEPSAEAPTSK